jgi:conjugative relaxase-like TrwC/TraI family protein
MMRMSRKPISLASAKDYFFEETARADYYTEQSAIVGHWYGKGAEALGLAGEVTPEAFAKALQGINPNTGKVLVPAALCNGVHKAGWDLALSAPKSVSVMALIGGDRRLIDAHNRAVEQTLPEIEAFALCHASGTDMVSGNIVAAQFNHFAARPSARGPDPHLHTHTVIMNMTQRPSDGEFRYLDPIQIYRSQAYGTALYLSNLAKEVEKLGYATDISAHYGAWEIKGFSADQVKVFSQRREDIRAYMAQHNLQGSIASDAGNIGRLSTRKPKEWQDSWTLEASWRERARQANIPLGNYLNAALKRGSVATPADPQTIREAVEFARNHTTEREAVVDRRQLEEFALERGMTRATLKDVRAQIAIEEKEGRLIRAGDSAQTHHHRASCDRSWKPGGGFTTDEMLRLEQDNLDIVRAGMGKATPIAKAPEVMAWALAKGLLPDQIAVAAATLASNHKISAIEGPAGSTKTTVVGAIKEFAEAQGYTVRGFGMTSGSVEALQHAGIKAHTIASLLHNDLPTPYGRELWFVDESSLISTRYANQLLKTAGALGIDRIVFVGDQRQHQAIEAGAPIRQFLQDNMMMAELQTIRRQQDPELRHAVELAAAGKPNEALDLLEEQQRVHEIPDLDARYQRIALDYLRSHEAGQATLVVSPGNDERRALNQEIRKLLVAQGQVSSKGREHAILVRRDLTMAQKQIAGSFREGDVLHFGRRVRGIPRGSYLQVAGVDWNNNTLTLHGKDGSKVTFEPRSVKHLQVYQWDRREIAAGDRIEFRIHDKANRIANHSLASIRELTTHEAKLKLDTGREVIIPLAAMRHVDLGYASTSHAAQGATVDRVIVNIDTMRSDLLINQEMGYVAISRGRHDARIYTDDIDRLRLVLSRKRQKEIALDAVETYRQQQTPSQAQTQQQSHGIRA